MAKQPLKKKEVKGFSVKNFKNDFLGENSKTADKEIEWIIMPSAFQEALKIIKLLKIYLIKSSMR